jgi:hypothetical protein
MKLFNLMPRNTLKAIGLVFFMPTIIHAQPAPCIGESVIILEGISNVDTNNLNVFIGQINYKGHYSTPWGKFIDSSKIDSDSLRISPMIMVESCYSHTYKSENSSKIYLIGFSTHNAVLVIKSNNKAMYLVLPNTNRVHEHLLSSLKKDLYDENFKNKKGYYSPDMYLPPITFKEGIYFLEDYLMDCNVKNTTVLLAKNVIEFYDPKYAIQKSPLNYWNDTLRFFSPYPEGLKFSKKMNGSFSESSTIEVILKNSSLYNLDIFNYIEWEKFIKNHEHTTADVELGKRLYEATQSQEQQTKALIQLYEDGKLSTEQLSKSYKALEKTQLMLLLENDFDLMMSFCNYLESPKTSIEDFLSFFEDGTYAVNEKKLIKFLKHQE